MTKHLRTRLTTKEVVEILERYLNREIGIDESLGLLKLKRRQFFKLLKLYREGRTQFNLVFVRSKPTQGITEEVHQKIMQKLAEEKRLIEDPNNPIRFYNYSYVKTLLAEKDNVVVSLPTIITRAKKTVTIRSERQSSTMIERC